MPASHTADYLVFFWFFFFQIKRGLISTMSTSMAVVYCSEFPTMVLDNRLWGPIPNTTVVYGSF